MKIQFSPPFISPVIENELLDVLRSGWITTGPKSAELQQAFSEYTGFSHVLAVNSWTSGAQLALKWFGIGAGDEVIVPAYTYAATALVVLHAGAIPVMVDVNEDFTIDETKLADAITPRTKAIIPVDFAGWPVNFCGIKAVINSKKEVFVPRTDAQEKLGRILLLSDAAHSIGATYKGKAAGLQADITVYSLHAVKNITSGEGGLIGINLPEPFSNEEEFNWMRINAMNGQTKDAFTKSKGGNWQYDIVSDGLKINMPDICAALALAQLRLYDNQLLVERKRIVNRYINRLQHFDWFQGMPFESADRVSSYHIFPVRIKGIDEQNRNAIIQFITEKEIAVNVHFTPLPKLTLFKELGYNMDDYPLAYDNYAREISLPVYPQLTNLEVDMVLDALEVAVDHVLRQH
jgi:dTDP-4-amino-4,6-dideoxygalactose transaminase